ncbi:hypothetical protein AB4Z48_25410 [Cupriavidus sp. 2TAF22]|uniref:hypothetical protein n=1 Tax=unclassified Cupriavidus TaxID=2640874 RepID=UPI003F8DDB94
MIELISMHGTAGTGILEVRCNDDTPQDVFLRFVRAKVSMENLLSASAILQTSRRMALDGASLRWEVKLPDMPAHLALARAALDVMGIAYLDKAGPLLQAANGRRPPPISR